MERHTKKPASFKQIKYLQSLGVTAGYALHCSICASRAISKAKGEDVVVEGSAKDHGRDPFSKVESRDPRDYADQDALARLRRLNQMEY